MSVELLRLSATNLVNQKRRSWLTVIGIFIGIAAVVALVSLGQGLEGAIEEQFEDIGASRAFVTADDLTDDDVPVVEGAAGVATVTGIYEENVLLTYRDETAFVTAIGVPTGPDQDIFMEMVSARVDQDIIDGRNVRRVDRTNIAISDDVADDLYERDVTIRDRVTFEGTDYQIVGIYESAADPNWDESLLIPIERARDVFDAEDAFTQLIIEIQGGAEMDQVVTAVESALRQDRGLEEGEEDFDVFTPQDIQDAVQNVLSVVQGIVLGIASISLLVGGVGIMNTMYTAVTERTREIGIMKAVGATDRQVLSIFLFEAGIIGLIGGIIGVITGLGLSYTAATIADQLTTIPVGASFDPMLILGALLFSFLVGAVSGVAPARQAANLEPVDALRYE